MKGNPLVTYDEIVFAIKSLIECSITSPLTKDDDVMSVKYYNEVMNITENDEALDSALKSLLESIESSSKIVRSTLEHEVVNEDKLLAIKCDYLFGSEKRKLACPDNTIQKLKNSSIGFDTLYVTPGEDFEYNKYENINTNNVYSDFERNALLNFPDYFKEEISIADDENDDIESFDANELFNTMELSHLLDKIRDIDISTNPTSNIENDKKLVEEVKIIKEENKKEKEEIKEEPKIELIDTKLYNKLSLINKALKKAKEKGNDKIVSYLEKELARELNK